MKSIMKLGVAILATVASVAVVDTVDSDWVGLALVGVCSYLSWDAIATLAEEVEAYEDVPPAEMMAKEKEPYDQEKEVRFPVRNTAK